jgi:hypothetical protein
MSEASVIDLPLLDFKIAWADMMVDMQMAILLERSSNKTFDSIKRSFFAVALQMVERYLATTTLLCAFYSSNSGETSYKFQGAMLRFT